MEMKPTVDDEEIETETGSGSVSSSSLMRIRRGRCCEEGNNDKASSTRSREA